MIYVVDHELLYQDKFAAIGSSVTIPCHGSNSTPVSWHYKNSAELNARHLYDGHHLGTDYVNKYTVNGSAYDLTILEVEVDDGGEYWCVVDGRFGVSVNVLLSNIGFFKIFAVCDV